MKELLGTCQLGRHATKGGYLLLRYPAGVLTGPIIRVSQEEMQSNGISIVLDHLRHPPRATAKKMSHFDEATKKMMLKIKRDFVLVTMSIIEDCGQQELKIIPLHAGRGWSFETRVEEIVRAQLPIANEQFLRVIGEAFEIAT